MTRIPLRPPLVAAVGWAPRRRRRRCQGLPLFPLSCVQEADGSVGGGGGDGATVAAGGVSAAAAAADSAGRGTRVSGSDGGRGGCGDGRAAPFGVLFRGGIAVLAPAAMCGELSWPTGPCRTRCTDARRPPPGSPCPSAARQTARGVPVAPPTPRGPCARPPTPSRAGASVRCRCRGGRPRWASPGSAFPLFFMDDGGGRAGGGGGAAAATTRTACAPRGLVAPPAWRACAPARPPPRRGCPRGASVGVSGGRAPRR